MFALAILIFGTLILRRALKQSRLTEPTSFELTGIKPRNYTKATTYIDERGYSRFMDSDKLVHRYIAEKKLGRRLEKWEVVHHIDGNKRNNSFRNLEVYQSWEEHDSIHRNNLAVYGNWHKQPERN